ncbi:unnamed protein product [Chrysodeixis includens]|uniref:C2H2-type domain-containing protein n=1 Tax=Chrysodeixis includens TaxID=689277 RepID=A0A9P0BIY9_CHRIL|nr:unnamed protein product [Chrysodeixis includens]
MFQVKTENDVSDDFSTNPVEIKQEDYDETIRSFMSVGRMPRSTRRTKFVNPEYLNEYVHLFCEMCNLYFKKPASWVRHVHALHTECELSVINNILITPKPIECRVCGKKFESEYLYKKHKPHPPKPIVCGYCQEVFATKTDLCLHREECDKQLLQDEGLYILVVGKGGKVRSKKNPLIMSSPLMKREGKNK